MFVSIQTDSQDVKLLNLNQIVSMDFYETKKRLSQGLALRFFKMPLILINEPVLLIYRSDDSVLGYEGKLAQELYEFITEAMQHSGQLKHAFELNENAKSTIHLLPDRTIFDES